MITNLECIINEMYPGAPYYPYQICMCLATVNCTFGAGVDIAIRCRAMNKAYVDRWSNAIKKCSNQFLDITYKRVESTNRRENFHLRSIWALLQG